ncbi:MAG: phage tail tape measure protein [Gallionellaceae bacterium]|jgi:hypothetical protein|nr:phage tail tape measure protein [Gallionellaceae bacterium]
MSNDIKLGISLSLNGAKDVGQATSAIDRQIRAMEERYRGLQASGKLSQKQLAAASDDLRKKTAAARKEIENLHKTVGNTAIGKYAANNEARRVLGIRSEADIQREIKRTEDAYQTLAKSGVLSAQQQARAYGAMRQQVRNLTNEMGKLTNAQKVMGAAGVAAAAKGFASYTFKEPLMNAVSYDERVGLLANNAFAEHDKAGRKIGEGQIREAIDKAIATGMTRDSALDALDKLIKDNQVGGVAGALEALPFIGEVSTGSGGSGVDAASMMGSFIQSGYAKDVNDAKRLMGISTAAATAGAFEKEDMAKYLPGLLPLAKSAGLTGEDGLRRLLVLLQQARTTAGSSDEAATNTRNLLTKLTSDETAKNFRDIGRGDLSRYLMMQRAKGIDPLTAYQNVIDAEIAKNPNLKAAIAKVQNATSGEEQTAAIEALTSMAEGQGIGTLFRDMQARGALFGMRNKAVEDEVNKAMGLSGSIIATDYESMSDRGSFRLRVANERKEMAEIKTMNEASPAISKVAEIFGDLAAKYPILSGATMLAAAALGNLAMVAGALSVATGGRGLPGMRGDAIGRVASRIGGMGGGIVGRGVGKLVKAGGVGLAGSVISGVGGAILDNTLGEDSAVTRYGKKAMEYGTYGAMLGSVVPGLGTGVGALGGAAVGLAVEGWDSIKSWFSGDEAAAPKMQAAVEISVTDDRVNVKSTKLTAENVNANMNTNTGNIRTGVPG